MTLPRDNGGVVGKANAPTSGVATGMWHLQEQYQAKKSGTWPGQGVTATGGTVVDASGSRWHIFTTSGTFTVSSIGAGTFDSLIVAGGGGGSGSSDGTAGGGGGGGLIWRPAIPLSVTSYPVGIGNSGPGGPAPNNVGSSGGNSTFAGLTALGGGGGIGPTTGTAQPGGCGGGAGQQLTSTGIGIQPSQPGDSGTYGHGEPGGSSLGGGGGGAGQAGAATGNPNTVAPGGNGYLLPAAFVDPALPVPALGGIPTSDPAWRYFAGGGGAGTGYAPNNGGNGGLGGGGRGYSSYVDSSSGLPATAGTNARGGGGGGGGDNIGLQGEPGGSGVVIIRYPYP